MNKLKLILMFIGFAIIFGCLASFLQSKSPLDIFLITVGMMTAIFAFYIEGEKVVVAVNYFVAMFCVNIFQWFILIYIFFINPVYITKIFFYFLVGALLLTITLIIQIHRNNLKYLGNSQKTSKKVRSNDKIKLMLNDKTKTILIFAGILILFGCLASFLQSKSLLELFFSSIGMIIIIYGFYRGDKKVAVAVNYFVAMFCVNIFQWFILIYILFVSQIYVWDDVSYALMFTFFFTFFLYMQLRESDMKYIGKRR
jgi:hypothetical protein